MTYITCHLSVCLSLPAGISNPTLGTGVPRWHLPESSAEQLLHYLHLGLMGQECQFFIKFLPWHGWGWDVPAPTVSAGATGAFVPHPIIHGNKQAGPRQGLASPVLSQWKTTSLSVSAFYSAIKENWKKNIMHGNSCDCIKLKLSSQREEEWGEEPLHKTSTASLQGFSNLIFHNMVLFYQELSGLRGSFVSLWFFPNYLRVWVISNFSPVFKEARC